MTSKEHFDILLKKGYNKQDLLKLDQFKQFASKEAPVKSKSKDDGKINS